MFKFINDFCLFLIFCLLFCVCLYIEYTEIVYKDNQNGGGYNNTNISIFPTIPKHTEILHEITINRIKRDSKNKRVTSKRDRKNKGLRKNKYTTKRKYLRTDIGSYNYDIKKHMNVNANPADYMYNIRMSVEEMAKDVLIHDIRKRFFNITENRKKLSQLEILKNQSLILYNNYMKIINQSSTINYWKLLRDARYNNTEPDFDYSNELTEQYKTFDYDGGTRLTAIPTADYSVVEFYKKCVSNLLHRIGTGPVVYGTGSDY